MRDWLVAEGYTSGPVHWLVNYACRDDYGCDYRDVSAWAGIHYFASRDAHAENAEGDTVLTWPEGNGWIVRRLLERYAPPVTGDALVYRLEERPRGVALEAYLAREDRSIALDAEHVVWAAPLRFAGRALAGSETALREALVAFDHAPWLVANLTLEEAPRDRHGAPLAWDNVLYDSAALGYVVATHQSLASHRGPTVITWYQPLCSEAPRAARERLLATPREVWVESDPRRALAPAPRDPQRGAARGRDRERARDGPAAARLRVGRCTPACRSARRARAFCAFGRKRLLAVRGGPVSWRGRRRTRARAAGRTKRDFPVSAVLNAVRCASCDQPMQPLMLARNIGGELQIDVCHPCHAIWFDRNESLQLAPGAVIELFRDINRHRDDARRQLAEGSSCPHCHAALVLTHDVVKTGRFTYYRCPHDHGRLTPFSEFLREKQFVRSLTPAELARVRVELKTVRCSSCGAPIDLRARVGLQLLRLAGRDPRSGRG